MATPLAATPAEPGPRATHRLGACGRASRAGEQGSTTVEFALGLPTVVVILAFVLSAVAWALDLESAQRGAGEGARAAIVQSDSTAVAIAKSTSGATEAWVSRSGGFVTVCVRAVRTPWPAVSRCAVARDAP